MLSGFPKVMHLLMQYHGMNHNIKSCPSLCFDAEKAMRTFAGPALPFIGGFYGDVVIDTVLY